MDPHDSADRPTPFGISIEGSTQEQILDRSRSGPYPFWVVTMNPEILVYAWDHPDYARTLEQADVRVVDGFGLWLSMRVLGKRVTRVTGVDLGEALIELAVSQDWKVGLIGGASGVGDRCLAFWKSRHPRIHIHAEQGGRVDQSGNMNHIGEEALHRMTLFAPDVLFVAFGHPKQEQWIAAHLSQFPSLKIIMGVGGTFDYWSGSIGRAPSWIRRLGLEWVWRLIRQPMRFRRICVAAIVFPVRWIAKLLVG